MNTKVAVLDIDGTVADIGHRRPLLEVDGPTRWVDFFQAAENDVPLDAGVRTAQTLAEELQIVWLTGRPERMRGLTEEWLQKYALPPGRLIMHPPDTTDSSVIVKVAQLKELALEFDIVTILDDDPRVVHALREAGFAADQVPWSTWQPSHGQQIP